MFTEKFDKEINHPTSSSESNSSGWIKLETIQEESTAEVKEEIKEDIKIEPKKEVKQEDKMEYLAFADADEPDENPGLFVFVYISRLIYKIVLLINIRIYPSTRYLVLISCYYNKENNNYI